MSYLTLQVYYLYIREKFLLPFIAPSITLSLSNHNILEKQSIKENNF